jgi:uncharacterized membrane protein
MKTPSFIFMATGIFVLIISVLAYIKESDKLLFTAMAEIEFLLIFCLCLLIIMIGQAQWNHSVLSSKLDKILKNKS